VEIFFKLVNVHDGKRSNFKRAYMITGKYDRQLDRSNRSKNVRDLALHQGWSYLATVLDLGNKEIVGYALSKMPDAKLAKQALINAIAKHQPTTSALLFHSDSNNVTALFHDGNHSLMVHA